MSSMLKKYSYLGCILIFIVMVVFGFIDYWGDYGYSVAKKNRNFTIQYCENVVWDELNEDEISFLTSVCQKVDEKPLLEDVFTMYTTIIGTKPLFYVGFFLPILVMFCVVFNFHSKLQNGVVKNELMREKYSTYIFREFKKCYYKIIPFVLVWVALFLSCCLISRNFELLTNNGMADVSFVQFFPWSYILYLIVLVINYAFYVNIALISARANKNIFVCLLCAYLSWLAVAIFTEVFVGLYLFGYVLDVPFVSTFSFNIVSLHAPGDISFISKSFLLILCLCLISSLILYLTYRKKEKVVIYSEK